MILCSLCQSLPLEDLPPFPDDKTTRTLSGKPRFHHIVLDDHEKGKPIPCLGVPYHPDLASLRQAASNGCVLFQAIEKEADALLEEIKTLEYPNMGMYKQLPDWNMWLTQRGESGGDGFWVVCSSVGDQDRHYLVPVASIGFASDEGEYLDSQDALVASRD